MFSDRSLSFLVSAAVTLSTLSFANAQPAQRVGDSWQAIVNTEVRYFSYSSSHASPAVSTASGGRGTQVYVPFAGQLVGRPNDDLKVDYMLRSAYVDAKQTTSAGTGTFSGLTDTTFSSSLTYFGMNGIQPFVSLSVNIPTGTSNAQGNAARAKTDSDIVQLPAFGEGWNVGPTVGANIPIDENTVAGVGVGYTWRGTFNREGATQGTTNRLDPGDVVTVNASIGYRGERLSLKGTAAYSAESNTTLDGSAFYKSGDRIVLTGAAGYAIDENFSVRGQLTYSRFGKNKVLLPGASALTVEAFNTNSDVYRAAADITYAKDKHSWSLNGGYVYRDRNGWEPTTFQFLPAKTSWSVGLASAYAASEAARLIAKVERIWVTEGGSPDKFALDGTLVPASAIPVAYTDAWQGSISGVFRF